MLDAVCIGAATEDIFFFSKRFEVNDQYLLLPWKEKFTVEELERQLGGGAFNASVAFSRLGLKSAFFGRVGDDCAGRSVKYFLEKERVLTDLLIIDPKVKTSTSALLSSGGERTIVMYRGENDNLLGTNPDWDRILDCHWIFLAELAGTSYDFVFELVKRLGKRKNKLAYIPGQRDLDLGNGRLKPVLARTDILICNRYEAEKILGRKAAPKEMLQSIRELGVNTPVITLGPEGSLACDGESYYYHEATPKVEVIDRTGAGDAFAATFTGGIILGRSIPESLLLAAKNASSVIAKVGGTAGLLTLSQLCK